MQLVLREDYIATSQWVTIAQWLVVWAYVLSPRRPIPRGFISNGQMCQTINCPPGVLCGIEVVTFNGVFDIIERGRHQGRETRTWMPGMGDGHDADKMISKSTHLVKVEAATWISNCQGIACTASKCYSLWQALWQRTHRPLCGTLRSPRVGVQLGWRRRCPFWILENIQISDRK